jgi:hypothetical protein
VVDQLTNNLAGKPRNRGRNNGLENYYLINTRFGDRRILVGFVIFSSGWSALWLTDGLITTFGASGAGMSARLEF